MGAWIETCDPGSRYRTALVAPYVGAWIETIATNDSNADTLVAPYVGAWIETLYRNSSFLVGRSHPTWVRGLKL